MISYCESSPNHDWHGPYHGTEYGFPVSDEHILFERLILEINQAGLSWLTVLKKREAFFKAYDGFDVDTVAAYGPDEQARLLGDAGIIRNKLKVNAAVENAKRIQALRDSGGGFKAWLESHHPLMKPDWVRLFKQTFLFTGSEITGEFLISTGYLPGAHDNGCPIIQKIKVLEPPWARVGIEFWGSVD
jgi:DNA-3-methyladenine glycosylase I